MAKPQRENGYTGIANEIMQEIAKVNLNGTQFRLVIVIWRYTYGFQRKMYPMSVRFLAEHTDAGRTQVSRELDVLIARNIVITGEANSKGRHIGFNKDYTSWLDREPSKGEVKVAPNKDKAAADKRHPAKKQKYSEDNQYYKMAIYFFKRVEKVVEEAGIAHLLRKSNMQTWADDMRKLVELKGVDKRKVLEVMNWVTEDSFWQTNILSARKLKDKFPELAIKMNADQKKSQPAARKADPRDPEIALQKWINEGNDPNDFKWN
ncbi:phage replication protein O [Terribacillus aidingensis]|uniref:Phage replication protein O n=1 Tax=Terribacillus aidingensis TaxID=586416 RepID=A0A285P3S7_9BACI|nr:replication protein [Terribacillus aidingensis]SNZ14521.1 phage replication protein O [Terribacillus aidingensis]